MVFEFVVDIVLVIQPNMNGFLLQLEGLCKHSGISKRYWLVVGFASMFCKSYSKRKAKTTWSVSDMLQTMLILLYHKTQSVILPNHWFYHTYEQKRNCFIVLGLVPPVIGPFLSIDGVVASDTYRVLFHHINVYRHFFHWY